MNKDLIHKACKEVLESRLEIIKNSMLSVQESMQEEEKSSMGDKYETGRTMAQNELIRLSDQQKVILHDMSALEQINPGQSRSTAQVGSLIQTDKRNLFIGVGIGKVLVGKAEVIAISPSSPLSQLLLGKKAGDELVFNNAREQIISVS